MLCALLQRSFKIIFEYIYWLNQQYFITEQVYEESTVMSFVFLNQIPTVDAANPISFCKCVCGSNITIFPISDTPQPEDCQKCTKAYCLVKQLKFCSGGGANNELTATCFQRDSWKDEIVVKSFIFVAGTLIFIALWQKYASRAWLWLGVKRYCATLSLVWRRAYLVLQNRRGERALK